jgi:hypothetical protein
VNQLDVDVVMTSSTFLILVLWLLDRNEVDFMKVSLYLFFCYLDG